MSPALALAAPALAIADQPPKPGGGWPATVVNAAASFSPSPLDEAPPITLFIQPCMGQGFWPLAPQSYVFAPAAALPVPAGVADGAPDPAATAAEAPGVAEDVAAAA